MAQNKDHYAYGTGTLHYCPDIVPRVGGDIGAIACYHNYGKSQDHVDHHACHDGSTKNHGDLLVVDEFYECHHLIACVNDQQQDRQQAECSIDFFEFHILHLPVRGYVPL